MSFHSFCAEKKRRKSARARGREFARHGEFPRRNTTTIETHPAVVLFPKGSSGRVVADAEEKSANKDGRHIDAVALEDVLERGQDLLGGSSVHRKRSTTFARDPEGRTEAMSDRLVDSRRV
jgi:hypothetical protein